MYKFIGKRLLQLIPTLIIISIIAFVIINLPPGDYLTSYIASLRSMGESVSESRIKALEEQFGLNRPLYVQYYKWISSFIKGDLGYSFQWGKPVSELIWGRLALTVVMTFTTMIFTWIVSFLVGVYSATHQYSIGDYIATFFGFIGRAIPNFLLALILMWIGYAYFRQNVGGLFSPEYRIAPWSYDKVIDFFKHLWIPIIVIGTAGTAGLIRILRANILDELGKPYVVTGRSKGLSERRLVYKYVLRVAVNPFIATAGWMLPRLISGAAIVSIVLNLPTTGPLLLRSLQSQDMYLAGSFFLLLSILTVLGTLISDLVLVWVDPRIKYE